MSEIGMSRVDALLFSYIGIPGGHSPIGRFAYPTGSPAWTTGLTSIGAALAQLSDALLNVAVSMSRADAFFFVIAETPGNDYTNRAAADHTARHLDRAVAGYPVLLTPAGFYCTTRQTSIGEPRICQPGWTIQVPASCVPGSPRRATLIPSQTMYKPVPSRSVTTINCA
jgi:hypothetical protein